MSNEYPAFRYRKTDHHTVVVLNKHEDESLASDWVDSIPEGFDLNQKMPTYRGLEFVVNPLNMAEIEASVIANEERRKPGPKPKPRD